ncbi:MAG: SLBB domain-containing protein [Ignavibacteriaceae bacterium]|nr:SLBB domain-containing protein [Ignavibacteriaceae bacterium]
MKLKLFILTFLTILISNKGLTQQLPDYPERFFQDSLSQISNASIPRIATEGIINPEEYRVGPGDKIFISISGVTEISNTFIIDQEGWLYIPRIGGIDLRKNTLAVAKEKISDGILRYFKDVDIFISLVDFRMIKISLVGSVTKPAVFVLSANSRLMDLVTGSKQLNDNSDLRNINVISKEGETKNYDLLSFLRFGDFSNNPILVEGDVVLIQKVDQVIRISGQINYPALYEFRSEETIEDLIKLAGGFTFDARKDSIELIRFLEDGKTQISNYFSYDEIAQNNIYLQNKDHVVIRKIPEYLIDHYAVVNGYVRYPGWYKINKKSTTLKEMIEEAGGFLDEASLTEASITRKMDVEEIDPEYERLKLIPTDKMTEDEYDYFKAKSRQFSGRVVVDFAKLFQNNDLKENIILRKNDIINVPEKKDYIIMLGQFVNPGKIIFDSLLTIENYIDLAGGFGWRALEGDVRIIRAKTGEWVDADEDVLLQPGDTIWAPEDPPGPKFWDVFTDALTVVAQLAAIVAASAAVIVATR